MQPLSLPNPALCLSSHPSEPLFTVGTTADYHIARTAPSVAPKILRSHHLSSVYSSAFFNDSSLASSGNNIHTFTDDKIGRVYPIPISGEDPSIGVIVPYDEKSFLVGDSDGGVHCIDIRAEGVVSALEQGDYITELKRVSHLGTDTVLSTSGDGTLCAYDLRQLPTPKVKLMYATDTYNDDLLSLDILQGHAIAGTLSGALNIYDLRFLDAGRQSDTRVDRFFGHPECVNSVISWDDVVITASGDGYIRVVDCFGRKLLGLLEYDMEGLEKGKRKKGDTWPVEGMVKIHGLDKPVFALRGHDDVIRFCDGTALVDDDDTEGPSNLNVDVDEDMRKKKRRKGTGIDNSAGFFDDL